MIQMLTEVVILLVLFVVMQNVENYEYELPEDFEDEEIDEDEAFNSEDERMYGYLFNDGGGKGRGGGNNLEEDDDDEEEEEDDEEGFGALMSSDDDDQQVSDLEEEWPAEENYSDGYEERRFGASDARSSLALSDEEGEGGDQGEDGMDGSDQSDDDDNEDAKPKKNKIRTEAFPESMYNIPTGGALIGIVCEI